MSAGRTGLEDKISELANAVNLLEGYLENVISRIYLISEAINDARMAEQAIQAIPVNGEADLVVPIGGDVMLQTRFTKDSLIMVRVGAGTVLVKGKDDAIGYLKAREEELTKALEAAQKDRQDIEARLAQARAELNDLLKQTGNV